MVNAFTRNPKYRVSVTKRGDRPTDVTNFILSVTTVKDLSSFVGKFTLVLRNRLDFNNRNNSKSSLGRIRNIEDFFRPMTYVQIFATTDDNNEIPLMRGFIDSVGSSESVSNSGAVDRTVITGSDMGKIFVKQRLFFRPELSAVMTTSAQRQSFLEGAKENAIAIHVGDFISASYGISIFSKRYTPNQFMHEMLNIFIHPYINNVLKNYRVPRMAEHLSGTFLIDTNQQIVPIKLYLPNLMTQHGSVLNLLNYAKNAPWCEMFLQEGADRTIFVFRATPWRVPDGDGPEKQIPLMTLRDSKSTATPGEGSKSVDLAQEIKATGSDFKRNKKNNDLNEFDESVDLLDLEKTIALNRIISKDVFRDDTDVYTYFATYPYDLHNYQLANINGLFQDPLATSNPFLFRAHSDFYGFRPIEIRSTFTPFIIDAKNPEKVSQKKEGTTEEKKPTVEEQIKIVTPLLITFLRQFNKAVADAYEYNPDYEKGTLQIMGDPTIKIGQYININIKGAKDASFYVEGVTHKFEAFSKFITTLRVTRGTASIKNGNSIVDLSLKDLEKAAVAQDEKRQRVEPKNKVCNVGDDNTKVNDASQAK